MGTRSVIARVKGDGFEGVYQHWDGYPSHTGRELYAMARRYIHECGQEDGLRRMMAHLIDDHPTGWSTAFPGTHTDFKTGEETHHDGECYCHTRGEGVHRDRFITDTGDACGAEWAYAINERTAKMFVFERLAGRGHMSSFAGMESPESRWTLRGTVDLCGPEPDWKAMEGDEE